MPGNWRGRSAPLTRAAWVEVAQRASVRFVEVEIVCSDPDEHQQRVETRIADIPGFRLPTWADVITREYHPWDRERRVIDTAGASVADSLSALRAAISG